jgi:hypothetical protein
LAPINAGKDTQNPILKHAIGWVSRIGQAWQHDHSVTTATHLNGFGGDGFPVDQGVVVLALTLIELHDPFHLGVHSVVLKVPVTAL